MFATSYCYLTLARYGSPPTSPCSVSTSTSTSHRLPQIVTMEGRGLTLRSKSRRQRPQISAPKPISGPLPPNTKAPDAGHGALSVGKGHDRDRAPQSDATSDLVKRRYSTRFNTPGDTDATAPPVPALPPAISGGGFGGLPSTVPAHRQPSPADGVPSSSPKVDLNALRDPSLPVERCMCILSVSCPS